MKSLTALLVSASVQGPHAVGTSGPTGHSQGSDQPTAVGLPCLFPVTLTLLHNGPEAQEEGCWRF